MNTEITKKAMGNGSFGIYARNSLLVTVYTVTVAGKFIGGFATRKAAVEAARAATR